MDAFTPIFYFILIKIKMTYGTFFKSATGKGFKSTGNRFKNKSKAQQSAKKLSKQTKTKIYVK